MPKHKIIPCNRWVIIKPIEEKVKQAPTEPPPFVLPEESKATMAPRYKTFKVVSSSMDALSACKKGETIIVEASMVEKVKIEGESFYAVSENYVLGRLARVK